MLFKQFENDDISVIISELLVATADSSDPLLDGSIRELLKTLRTRLGMDVVFVSEFVDGQRVFRFVDCSGGTPSIKPGDSNPVEETYCQRVVDGRLPGFAPDVLALDRAALPTLPFQVGAYLSTPIVLRSAKTYGTLCCFSQAPEPSLRDKDLVSLRHCAALVARQVEIDEGRGNSISL